MQAPQRMHLSEVRNSSVPSRADRPLSTSTMCISPPARGPRKCEVYCVIGEPSALHDKRRMNTARCSSRGMIFSMPIEAICSFRHVRREVGVALVGADEKAAGLSDGEVAARHAGV